MVSGADIRIEGVSKSFDGAQAVVDASFAVAAGAFAALLGPSGCGKSTVLRLIAGLEAADAGRISIGGRDVSGAPPSARGVAMVFQSYALFPHLSVRDNILFGLSVRKTPAAEQKKRLDSAVVLLELGPYLDRKPAQLSGGQQQRVALGRAIVAEAPVCLMDEPLSNLDAQLRGDMRREIRELQKRLGLTMLYVTHDQVEAMTMADSIVLMNGGRIEQHATPHELYSRPETSFAARFIGAPPMNLAPASSSIGGWVDGAMPLGTGTSDLIVGMRPENLRADPNGLPARVTSVEYLGADSLIQVQIESLPLIVRMSGETQIAPGDTIMLSCASNDLHFFDKISGRRVNC